MVSNGKIDFKDLNLLEIADKYKVLKVYYILIFFNKSCFKILAWQLINDI